MTFVVIRLLVDLDYGRDNQQFVTDVVEICIGLLVLLTSIISLIYVAMLNSTIRHAYDNISICVPAETTNHQHPDIDRILYANDVVGTSTGRYVF